MFIPIMHYHIHYEVNCDTAASETVRTCFLLAMVAYVIGQTIIFSSCFFLSSSSSSFFFSSPNLSGQRLDVYRTLAHGVALVRI